MRNKSIKCLVSEKEGDFLWGEGYEVDGGVGGPTVRVRVSRVGGKPTARERTLVSEPGRTEALAVHYIACSTGGQSAALLQTVCGGWGRHASLIRCF